MLLHQITPVLSRSGGRPEISESPSKASVRHLLFQAFPFALPSLHSPFVAAAGLCWLSLSFPTLAPFIAFPAPPPSWLWYSPGDSGGLGCVTEPRGARGRCFGVQPSSWRPEGRLLLWGAPHSAVSSHSWVFNLTTRGVREKPAMTAIKAPKTQKNSSNLPV